ncbi:hypothetical protein [Bosea sp. FBZP-16]|uniref:hypothetical protein n=1 Tax=Bosea sp. FBZP-16 TaxID=2065382 RepID=UPI000C31A086|nr:hypothetical protein [Bosea sp. FBZP-16]
MFKAVTDSATAADGGSLALFVERLDGTIETFVVDRSLASRGTSSYNKVSSSLRALTPAGCGDIAEALDALAAETPGIHPVAEFVGALRQQR